MMFDTFTNFNWNGNFWRTMSFHVFPLFFFVFFQASVPRFTRSGRYFAHPAGSQPFSHRDPDRGWGKDRLDEVMAQANREKRFHLFQGFPPFFIFFTTPKLSIGNDMQDMLIDSLELNGTWHVAVSWVLPPHLAPFNHQPRRRAVH